MGRDPPFFILPLLSYIISDSPQYSSKFLASAWERVITAHRPATVASQKTHFKTYLSFLFFYHLPQDFLCPNLLAFLEFLYQNLLSPKVIRNYLSSLSSLCSLFRISSDCNHPALARFLRSISINSHFRPTPRGVFDVPTLYHISKACDLLSDPVLFRAIFLTAFYGFLRMSNLAPHSIKTFDQSKHFLRQDLFFDSPGAHLLLKWTKTLQDHRAHHIIQLPAIDNYFLCPVRALRALLTSRPLPPSSPLFANISPPFNPVIDTHVREALKTVLNSLAIPLSGHGFHTFRRSGATLAFDNNVSLQNIMAHGLWRSSAVWSYLQNASIAPSTIPATFASIIPSSF